MAMPELLNETIMCFIISWFINVKNVIIVPGIS